jgi:rhodanese-related sulfurtransferase
MPSPTEITVSQLARLIGLPQGPVLIDVRTAEDYAADARLIPGSVRFPAEEAAASAAQGNSKSVVAICSSGKTLSQGVAARLRHDGISAETLEGGFSAWANAGHPLLKTAKLPPRDSSGRTVWVTRARPKIDRIACPWLIARFIDPNAVFLFVAASEVLEVAERFAATPFDIEGVFWSHRGDRCSFDTMIEEFGLDIPPLQRIAAIVRAADTARLDLAPEAAGLLAVSLGFSRMYRDDLQQLAAAMAIYDGFYRWARDATDETHNWPARGGKP